MKSISINFLASSFCTGYSSLMSVRGFSVVFHHAKFSKKHTKTFYTQNIKIPAKLKLYYCKDFFNQKNSTFKAQIAPLTRVLDTRQCANEENDLTSWQFSALRCFIFF